MSIDINKPLVRRDGIKVDWIHEVHGGYVYGYSSHGVKRCTMEKFSWQSVKSRDDSPNDIFNTPEYEYKPLAENFTWYSSMERSERLYSGIEGFVRRPVGSTNIDEYEIVQNE